MQVVLLAAGYGNRFLQIIPKEYHLSSVSVIVNHDYPKSMTYFNNTPFLYYLVRFLLDVNYFQKIIILIGVKGSKIKQYLNSVDFGKKVVVIEDNVPPSGTGGGLIKAISHNFDDTLIMNTDTIVELQNDLKSIFHEWRIVKNQGKGGLSILSERHDLPNAGAFQVDKCNNIIFSAEANGLKEDKRAVKYYLTSTGCHILSSDFLKHVSFEYGLSLEVDILGRAIKQNALKAYTLDCEKFVWDFGTKNRFQDLLNILELNPFLFNNIYNC